MGGANLAYLCMWLIRITQGACPARRQRHDVRSIFTALVDVAASRSGSQTVLLRGCIDANCARRMARFLVCLDTMGGAGLKLSRNNSGKRAVAKGCCEYQQRSPCWPLLMCNEATVETATRAADADRKEARQAPKGPGGSAEVDRQAANRRRTLRSDCRSARRRTCCSAAALQCHGPILAS